MMNVAIPLAQGKLCQHFGHCESFVLIEVDPESRTIVNREELSPPAHEPGVFPRWLAENGASVIIAGGMGGRAQSLFTQQGITVVTGAPAEDPESLVLSFLNETLETGDNVCDH